jgi:hypothetical protein
VYYTTYVEKSTGGTSGGKGGGTGGSSGGKGSTGGKGGSTSSGGNSGSSSGGKVTVKKSSELSKLPPAKVTQPDGTAIFLNMNDFCYMPNANALNAVAFQQCVTKKKHDDDVPVWLVVLIIGLIAAVIVGFIALLLSSD